MSYQNENGATADPWEVVKRGQENTERMVERFTNGFGQMNEAITQLSKDLSTISNTIEILAVKVEADLESEREAKKRLYAVIDELKEEQKQLEGELAECKAMMQAFMIEYERDKAAWQLATGRNKWQLGLIATIALVFFGSGVTALFKFFTGGGA